jgi:hypothetical protein
MTWVLVMGRMIAERALRCCPLAQDAENEWNS